MPTVYDKLLELINSSSNGSVPFDLSMISFGTPVPDSSTIRNTKITVSSIAGKGFIGSVDLFYNRISLSAMGNVVWLFSDTPFTPASVVSLLNDGENAFLLVDDVESIIIPDMCVGDIYVLSLTAKPDSINWTDKIDTSLIVGFPSIANSLRTLMNTALPAPGYLS